MPRPIAGDAPARHARAHWAANVRTGLKLAGFEQVGQKVSVSFSDTSSGTTMSDEADLLVGADVIHSMVRKHFFRPKGGPMRVSTTTVSSGVQSSFAPSGMALCLRKKPCGCL